MINIDDLITQATLESNKSKKEAYRAIKADMLLLKTDKNHKGEITEAELVRILRKLINQLSESISMYLENDRKDSAIGYIQQKMYIEELLPPEISKDKIEEAVVTAYPNGYTQKEMGKVIKEIKTIFPTADGKIIAQIVKSHIQ